MHEHPWPKTAEALMRSRFAAVRDPDAKIAARIVASIDPWPPTSRSLPGTPATGARGAAESELCGRTSWDTSETRERSNPVSP